MSENEENFQISQEKLDHHFTTETPNIVLDIGLSPYEGWVYTQLKRIAGDSNACCRTLKSLSEACLIKETKLKEILKFLSEVNPKVGVALIKIFPRLKKDGSKDSNLIFINNIWKLNGEHFRSKSKAGGGSPHDYKEDPISSSSSKASSLNDDDSGKIEDTSGVWINKTNGQREQVSQSEMSNIRAQQQ